MRVLFYAKMLKETENEKAGFFVKVLSLAGISIEGARAPWAKLLATPTILR